MEVVQIHDYNDIIKNYDPTNNKTKNILTKYEKVKLIGVRTEQLQRGAAPLIDTKGFKEFSPRDIALEELKQRKMPFMICRTLPDGSKEYYRLQDMIIIA